MTTKSGLVCLARRRISTFAVSGATSFHSDKFSGSLPTRGLSRKHFSIALVRPSLPITPGFKSSFRIIALSTRMAIGWASINHLLFALFAIDFTGYSQVASDHKSEKQRAPSCVVWPS
jgi:hypothetical protein